MAIIVLKCPHCLAMGQLKIIGSARFPPVTNPTDVQCALGTVCPACHQPVAVLARFTGKADLKKVNDLADKLTSLGNTLQEQGFAILDYWPKPPAPVIPEHLPDQVAKALLQAENNFPLKGHEEAAGSMYRRALELALAHRYPGMTGTLAARIKNLVGDGVLTKELGGWADGIRLIGNDAAHAEAVTPEDLTMARAFTDAVLRYIFTLPEQVRLREASKK